MMAHLKCVCRSTLCVLVAVSLFALVGCVPSARAEGGERISVSGTEFRADGKRIWLNGSNTPWHVWNDFLFTESPGPMARAYGLGGGKPAIIGECPAKGTSRRSSKQDYEDAYLNGWQGVLGWTSNGVDGNGGLEELGPATRAFRDSHLVNLNIGRVHVEATAW